MRENLAAQINKFTTGIFLVSVFAIPLIVATTFTEYYETPKFVFLFVVALLLLILRSVSWVLEGKVKITRTPLDIPLLLFLTIIILSTIFSPVKQISFMGQIPAIDGSAISWIIYILFYFLATIHLKSRDQIKYLFIALGASTIIGGILALLSYFGIYMSFSFAKFANFTPTGSAFSTTGLIVLLMPVLLSSLVLNKKLLPDKFVLAVTTFLMVLAVLIGDLSTVIGLTLGILIILLLRIKDVKANLIKFSTPILVGLIVLVISASSIGGSANFLHQQNLNYPREIQLPFGYSWIISASSFRDHAFLGSGPATFAPDFNLYKPAEYNLTPLWNVRFQSPFNQFFEIFATTGLLGILAFAFLSLLIIGLSWKDISKRSDDSLYFGLAISALLTVVLLALHPGTLVFIFAALLILAMLMGLNKGSERVEELSIGIKASKITDSSLVTGDALPLILFIPIVIISIFAFWKASYLIRADYHHRLALNYASTNALNTYNQLVMAEQLSPMVDLYRTDLAQTNFALANTIVAAKGPTQASPSGSLTDADKQNIQTLLSQSISEGKAAVTLNPLSSPNWEILASIYRQISGVANNALEFSLDAYGHAIQRDPYNPLLRLSVGGVYYSVKNYDMAIRFFSDAINLKPDFANGYYNLAVALRDKGDLQGALASAEQVVSLVTPTSPDYKTATKLVDDLKNQASQSATTNQTPATPPAAAENGVLQNKNLPKVNVPDLSNPPTEISTPSAVKKASQ